MYEPTAEEKRIVEAREALPHPRSVLNLSEIEVRIILSIKRLSQVIQYL